MKEFSPDEQKELNLERAVNDSELIMGGAQKKRDGRLEVTRAQLEEAAVEKHLSQKVPQITLNQNFEISETTTFSKEEIIDVIAKFENLEPEDFFIFAYTVNADDEIIDANIRLRADKSYEKYRRDVTYIYEIRGFTRNRENKNYFDVNEDDMDVPKTTIAKFFKNSDTDELNLRNDVKIEYARTQKERDVGLNEMERINRDTKDVDFLIFDGKEWWLR